MTTLNEDESALVLTGEVLARSPFFFIKLGDAAVELVNGYGRKTCDGEVYTNALANALLTSWTQLREKHTNLYVGDWRTASFSGPSDRSRYDAEYKTLMGAVHGTLLHFECLLLMRESDALLGFYRAVREDFRRKLLMGPAAWEPLAKVLKCDFLALPVMANLFSINEQVASELKCSDFEVLLYGAGTAGHVSVIDCWEAHPERTYINLGSALDPACSRGKTRKQQLAPHRAKAFIERLLPRVTPRFRDWCEKGHAKGTRGCPLCEPNGNITTAGRGNSLLKRYEEANTRARQQNGGVCSAGHMRGQRGCALCEDLL